MNIPDVLRRPTNISTITAKDVIAAVRRLADNSPNCQYKPPDRDNGVKVCFNKEGECTNGSTGCIVGQALVELFGADKVPNEGGVATCVSDLQIRATPQQYSWLQVVQGRQDNGCPWEFAVEQADEYYPLEV